MALTTRQNRQSAVSLLVPSYIPGVVPTGTVDQNERQASIWSYSGVAAGLLSLIVARPKDYANRQVAQSVITASTTTSTLTDSITTSTITSSDTENT